MIPKKIHYCWFGGNEKPKLAKKCIESWQKYCPDYEIIEWNEDNFDINTNAYTKWCYENKKYAFLSDYVRLVVVYENGGIYFDTDVEVIRNIDFLLNNEAFFGFETDDSGLTDESRIFINTGLSFGSVAGGIALHTMIKEYDQLLDGMHGVIMCPKLNTEALVKIGLDRDGLYQRFSWGSVYPNEFFNPYESTTGVLNITENTVSIHWYMGSCLTVKQKIRTALGRPIHRIFGKNIMERLKR